MIGTCPAWMGDKYFKVSCFIVSISVMFCYFLSCVYLRVFLFYCEYSAYIELFFIYFSNCFF